MTEDRFKPFVPPAPDAAVYEDHWKPAPGAYYTPPDVLRVVDPACGTGAWLWQRALDVLGNPPYGDAALGRGRGKGEQ